MGHRDEVDPDAEVPRFVADAMLGKLARWLRYLGYDTVYVHDDDAAVAYRARSEQRVLLTGDHALAHRTGLRTILLEAQSLREQLRQVVDRVGLPPEATPRRCMACNVPLVRISRKRAAEQVPAYVAKTQEVFDQCSKCGRIYWPGTHRQGIEQAIDRALTPHDT